MRQITIAGNDTNTLTGATTITIDTTGIRPFFVDESTLETDNAGTLRRMPARRLAYDVTLLPFRTVPQSIGQDTRTYFDLMNVLYKRFIWITAIGADVPRFNHPTMGLIPETIITLPLAVQVQSISEFEADFERGVNDLSSIVLAERNWYGS